MRKELKKITDLTINELLNNEVILHSIYFEKFNKNASQSKVEIEDKDFQSEINKLLVEDYNSIETYMESIESNVSILKESANQAKTALLEKNIDELSNVYKRMLNLEGEISKLNKKLYYDESSSIHNRKWIYNKFLNSNSCFKTTGVVALIDIVDFDYIKNEYGELLANNLILFVVSFIKKNLKNENFDFKIAKFFENKLLLLIENEELKDIKHILVNMENMLKNTTLKSNAGLMIKASYKFSNEQYLKNQDSKDLFEKLFIKLKES